MRFLYGSMEALRHSHEKRCKDDRADSFGTIFISALVVPKEHGSRKRQENQEKSETERREDGLFQENTERIESF
jgi:hypothetical protein